MTFQFLFIIFSCVEFFSPQPPAEREKLLDPDKDSISDEDRAAVSGSTSDEELMTSNTTHTESTFVNTRE